MFELTNKIAVVTGAGSGIGQAIARLFAQQGALVIGLDIDTTGKDILMLPCDVSDASQVREVFGKIDAEFHRVDILVNNAGIAHVGNILRTTEDDFDRIYQVNVKGVYLCSKSAIEIMLRNKSGVILNLASIVSLIGVPDRFAYTMSKGAVLTMTRSIAVDHMKDNIRCNCICPARVHTPFVDGYVAANFPGQEKEMLRTLSEYQPMGRMGTPEEVAALALYLCSDEASFITGQAYPIDGGVLVT